MNDNNINVRISRTTFEQLKLLAFRLDLTKKEIVARAVGVAFDKFVNGETPFLPNQQHNHDEK